MSFIESLDDAGIVWSDYDAATGWPKAMNLDRLVILQYPNNDSRQVALRRTLKGACRRKEILSTPAMEWAGLYLSSPDVQVPFDRLLETTDLAIDAPAFSEWLKRSDTEPSAHVAAWFTKFGILERTTGPAQNTATPAPVVPDEVDFTLVATRKELIDAFGKFTGMNMTWFDNLNDSPKLKAARKFTGQGGRHSSEPLFCPHEVMQWLANPKRRKGKSLSVTTAWRLLKNHFPKVYNQYSIGDPNAD